jgi:ABC-type sugar transport system substrate-binding protein
VPTVSRNGSPEAIAEVRSGRTTATLDYHLPEIGRLAGRTALAALAGALAPDTLVARRSASFSRRAMPTLTCPGGSGFRMTRSWS